MTNKTLFCSVDFEKARELKTEFINKMVASNVSYVICKEVSWAINDTLRNLEKTKSPDQTEHK